DLVVRDGVVLAVPVDDGDPTVELTGQRVQVIVLDRHAPGHVRVIGRQRLVHATHLHAVAGDVGGDVAPHDGVVCPVPEFQSGRAEVGEDVAGDLDPLGVPQRDVPGFLGPGGVRAGPARYELAQSLGRPAGRAGVRVPRLNLREALVRGRREPR